MALFPDASLSFVRTIDALVYENPFSKNRVELEKRALGSGYSDQPDAWRAGPGHHNENLTPLLEKVASLLKAVRPRLCKADPGQVALYRSLLRYFLYYTHEDDLYQLSRSAHTGRLKSTHAATFRKFEATHRHFMSSSPEPKRDIDRSTHLWAICFQVRRAFEEIFGHIVGASEPAARLRAEVWESVFTRDMRRYERSLYDRMHKMNTLIVGASGTGKELVARAIGLSRFVPFDRNSERFVEETHESFFPLNLSALSANLVESELFGHKKGSFTGASSDRVGFLESCPEQGTVFLDEIGELSEAHQVKLLRTIQTRELSRMGEHVPRRFAGKLVTATNRDLAEAVRRGSFRADFFYRLRADQITTPTLRAQLDDHPDDLRRLVNALSSRLVPESEVPELVDEAVEYIELELGDHPWPGNVRELEQCLLSYIVHGTYHPADSLAEPNHQRAFERFLSGDYSLEEVSDLYVTLAYRRYGSYSETARALGLDRRTVKSKVNPALL